MLWTMMSLSRQHLLKKLVLRTLQALKCRRPTEERVKRRLLRKKILTGRKYSWMEKRAKYLFSMSQFLSLANSCYFTV
ncbi:hypothetical protein K439DRAFT_818818 [Ramaria rubella]|nr:hypothetical protein K439DRAFT_818818 [Ramaria rubella]